MPPVQLYQTFSDWTKWALENGRILFVSKGGLSANIFVGSSEYLFDHHLQWVGRENTGNVVSSILKATLIVYFETESHFALRKLLEVPGIPVIRFSSVRSAPNLSHEVLLVAIPFDQTLSSSIEIVLETLSRQAYTVVQKLTSPVHGYFSNSVAWRRAWSNKPTIRRRSRIKRVIKRGPRKWKA